MTKITKAMVLAAGFGTRLRPLTYETPKALLPLQESRLIDYPLELLEQGGITRVVINLHHLGDQIRDYIGNGSRYGLKVAFSIEEPNILGTGGGIRNVQEFMEDDPFVVINGDTLIKANLKELINRHNESGAAATMALMKIREGDGYQPVAIDGGGFVTGFGKGENFYVGLQIVTKEFLDTLPPAGKESCLVEDGYKPFIKGGGKVAAYIYEGYFNDVGTPERYEKAQGDCLSGVCKLR